MMYVYSNEEKNKKDVNRDMIVRDAVKQLRGRGIATKVIASESEVREKLQSCQDCLFIPYSFSSNFHSLIVYCNQKNIPIITVHVYPQYFPDCSYCTITRDPYDCMRNILAYFIYNKGDNIKIAYFGMSPNTLVDQAKMNALYSLYAPMENSDFYFNDKGFIECFERFYERRHEYDAVVCANTHISVAFFSTLNERDPETAKKIMVVSFLDTKIAKFYHIPITISAYCENAIYDAVISMYKNAKKQKYIYAMNFTLKTKLLIRESSGNKLPPPEEYVYKLTAKYYYGNRSVMYGTNGEILMEYENDPDLKEIIVTENLLSSADKLDFKIIWLFLMGYKNSEISDMLYVSIQTIQYRSRELYKILGVESKKDFVNILSKYICIEKLQRYILDTQSEG